MTKPVLLCLALLLSLPVSNALADAIQGSATRAVATRDLLAGADAVALVTVTSVSSLINHSMSLPGAMSVEAYVYQVEVDRQWHGDTLAQARLSITVQQCSRPLSRGERYLVFAQRAVNVMGAAGRVDGLAQPIAGGGAGEWRVASCEHAVPAARAGAHLAQLKQLLHSPVAHHQP